MIPCIYVSEQSIEGELLSHIVRNSLKAGVADVLAQLLEADHYSYRRTIQFGLIQLAYLSWINFFWRQYARYVFGDQNPKCLWQRIAIEEFIFYPFVLFFYLVITALVMDDGLCVAIGFASENLLYVWIAHVCFWPLITVLNLKCVEPEDRRFGWELFEFFWLIYFSHVTQGTGAIHSGSGHWICS